MKEKNRLKVKASLQTIPKPVHAQAKNALVISLCAINVTGLPFGKRLFVEKA